MRVIKDRSESPVKWVILCLTCLMMFGDYYCYDIPAALYSQMDEYFGKPDNFETLFSLLYTLYAVPNIVLPFFGGFFTDKWGARFCLLMFSSLLTIGQVVFALGLSIKSWPLMFLGRIIFGCGGENMNVANSAILSVWFKDKELAFAFGLNLSISRLGSVANNLISPVITDSVDIVFALWFGVLLCGCSVACAVLISHLDHGVEVQILQNKGLRKLLIPRETDKMDDRSMVKDLLVATSEDRHSDAEKVVIVSPITVADDNHLDGDNHDYLRSSKERSSSLMGIKSPLTSIAIPSHKVDDNDATHDDASHDDAADVHTHDQQHHHQQVEPSLRDIFSFKLVFWIICCSCVVVYGCVLPFNNIASALLLERDYFKDPPDGCHLMYNNACQNASNIPIDCPSSRWYQPPLPLHVVVDGHTYAPLTSSDIDCTDSSWKDGCTMEFCSRQTHAQLQAATIMSIPYIISACLSPILGGFVDLYGKRAVMATFAPSILVIVHSFLGYSDCSPVGPLVGQGIAYSIFAAVIWPCIPLVVPENLVGLAYGALFSIQSAGLAVFPLLIAFIYADNGKHYIPAVELFFIVVAVIGVLVGVYLNYHDYFHINSKLNDPSFRASTDDHDDDDDGDDRPSGLEYQATNSYALVNPLLQDSNTDNDRHYSKRDI